MKKKDTITQEMIDNWKKEYGHIFKTSLSSESYIFRPLKRSEYVDVMTTQYDDDKVKIFKRQDEIVKKAVLWPENIDEIVETIGGVATTLADSILEKSGFDISQTEEL